MVGRGGGTCFAPLHNNNTVLRGQSEYIRSEFFLRSLPGRREGAKFVNWRIWPNTVLSSRLIDLAGKRGGWQMQHRAKGIIFRMVLSSPPQKNLLSIHYSHHFQPQWQRSAI
jgi:hypothetical protein